MSLVLLVPVLATTAVAAAAAWLAAAVARSLVALRAEVSALSQLAEARDLLLGDLERTRRHLDRPAEVWPSGPGR